MALLLPLASSCQSKGTPGGGGEPVGQLTSALIVGDVTIDGVGYKDPDNGTTVLVRGQNNDVGQLGKYAGGNPITLYINSAGKNLGAVSQWKVVTNGVAVVAPASGFTTNGNGTSDINLQVDASALDSRINHVSFDAECAPVCQYTVLDPENYDVIDIEAWDAVNGKIASYSFTTRDRRSVDQGASGNGVCDQSHLDKCEGIYGSTYASNCTCLFCTKYCDVNGVTTKSGTCC
jgi:hypothetical protein